MNTIALPPPEDTARHNYQRLFWLRNAEIAFIGLAIGTAILLFELVLPLSKLLAVLGLITGLNIYTWYR